MAEVPDLSTVDKVKLPDGEGGCGPSASTSLSDMDNGYISFVGAAKTVDDTIRLHNEELFTLESFGDLLADHWEKNKSFLIARVTTRDKIDPCKRRWSYYSAHHFNKILFRWGSNNVLQHRYNRSSTYVVPPPVNPATNSEVVGEVEYFACAPHDLVLREKPARRNSAAPSSHSSPGSIGGSMLRLLDRPSAGNLVIDGHRESDSAWESLLQEVEAIGQGQMEQVRARAELEALASSSEAALPEPSRNPLSVVSESSPIRVDDLNNLSSPCPEAQMNAPAVPEVRTAPSSGRPSPSDPALLMSSDPQTSTSALPVGAVGGRARLGVDALELVATAPVCWDQDSGGPVLGLPGSQFGKDAEDKEGAPSLGAGATGTGTGGVGVRVEKAVRAEFIGTDYNFAYSEPLRAVFVDNALDTTYTDLRTNRVAALSTTGEAGQEATLLPQPAQPAASETGSLMMALSRWAPQLGEAIERASSTGQHVIDVPYSRAVVFGSMGSLYVLTSFLIFSVALMHLTAADGTNRKGDWYWSFLPFFSFTTDRFIAIIYLETEMRLVVALKFMLWTFYIIFPTLVFPPARGANLHMVCRDALDIMFPIMFLIYSICYYVYLSRRKRLC